MTTHDGSHDFDFLLGTWRIRNRRLQHPLRCHPERSEGSAPPGADDWYEFGATAVERALWDGQANIEEYDADTPTGRVRGLALRLYNPQSRQWSINWSSSTTGTLDHPLVGEFHEGRGVFYGHDVFEGRAILARFIWTRRTTDACRWEQAFSSDGGTSWETNWIMEFTRAQ